MAGEEEAFEKIECSECSHVFRPTGGTYGYMCPKCKSGQRTKASKTKGGTQMRRVYICSPLRAGNGFTIEDNIALAKELCAATTRAGYAAFASHVFYPLFLDDTVAKERELAQKAGTAWLCVCDEMWVFAEEEEECTEGMISEIRLAERITIPPTVIWMPKPWAGIVRKKVAA